MTKKAKNNQREQFDIVVDSLLDTIQTFEDQANAGIVAYGLLTLGAQLAHDYCPPGQDWKEIVALAMGQVCSDPACYGRQPRRWRPDTPLEPEEVH